MPRPGNPIPWVRKAEQDYAAACALARRRKTPLPDVVCFHAQQCAEKYLKAYLVLHRTYFPKTHDLLELLDLAAPLEPSLALLKPRLQELRPYAVASRYPGEGATVAQSRLALRQLALIREQLRRLLRLRAGSSP